MKHAKEEGFDERPKGHPIFTGDYKQGIPDNFNTIKDDSKVDLRKDNMRIQVRSVKRQKDGIFVGFIYGFEPKTGLEFKGLKLGEEICFEEKHVFKCDHE